MLKRFPGGGCAPAEQRRATPGCVASPSAPVGAGVSPTPNHRKPEIDPPPGKRGSRRGHRKCLFGIAINIFEEFLLSGGPRGSNCTGGTPLPRTPCGV